MEEASRIRDSEWGFEIASYFTKRGTWSDRYSCRAVLRERYAGRLGVSTASTANRRLVLLSRAHAMVVGGVLESGSVRNNDPRESVP